MRMVEKKGIIIYNNGCGPYGPKTESARRSSRAGIRNHL